MVHGALLKGDSVHDIGAECLIRYFLKEYYENEEEDYRVYMDDCFSSCRVPSMGFCDSNRHIADEIITCLQEYHRLSREILELDVDLIKKYCPESCLVFTSMINTLIVLITQKEEEEERIKDVEDYKYIDCLLYTSPSPRDQRGSRMPSSA